MEVAKDGNFLMYLSGKEIHFVLTILEWLSKELLGVTSLMIWHPEDQI